MSSNGNQQDPTSRKALRTLALASGVGALAIVVNGLQAANAAAFFSITSVALVVAGAAELAGGILGFLFGIPRTLQHEAPEGAGANAAASVDYKANTNLEQISDWLTKMLVGVGLTQLTAMPGHLDKLSLFLAKGLGGRPGDPVFALSILLYFSGIGFLFGYLWTRLCFAGALRQADLGALQTKVEESDRKIDKVQEESDRKIDKVQKRWEKDFEALNYTHRQLNPRRDIPPVTQEDLDAAVLAASRPIRVQIFNQAMQVRTETWRDDKPRMELTIPIFRALIRSDSENQYHRNHGQLGFALKDQRQPDWEEALSELNRAIEIRDSREEGGWLYYEFNRAICLIMLDKAFAKNERSEEAARSAILTDLRIASQGGLNSIIRKDDAINGWMSRNEIADSDLSETS